MAMTIDEAIIHAEKKGQELGCTECAHLRRIMEKV